jgi:hypothetical protein
MHIESFQQIPPVDDHHHRISLIAKLFHVVTLSTQHDEVAKHAKHA